jgi:hypothetical protein
MSLASSQYVRSNRRRRLLTEDRSTAAGAAALRTDARLDRVTTPPERKSEHYGDAEFLQQQPLLLDLVPRRPLAMVLWLLAGLMVLSGLVALYGWLPDWMRFAAGSRPAAFDLAAKGSLANWFASLMLVAASIVAVLVYTIRRHRTDDYHGHYRVWLWAALCWFLLASDTAASLHEAFRDGMTRLTGTRLLGDGAVWWLAAYGFLLGAVGSRLLLDLWHCRLATATFAAAVGCYAAALGLRMDWIPVATAAFHVMLQQGLLMLGHLWLLTAMAIYARYVILDAQGLLPPRAAKKPAAAKKKKAKDEEPEDEEEETDRSARPHAEREDNGEREDNAEDDWVAVDSPRGAAQPVLRRAGAPAASNSTAPKPALPAASKPAPALAPKPAPLAPSKPAAAAAAKPAQPAAASPAPLQETDDQKLSKADRKAMKKRLLDDRLKREQQRAGGWGK